MKKIYLMAALLFVALTNAQSTEIQKTIETFFEGFHAKDSVKIKSVCSAKLLLQSIKENQTGGKLTDDSPKDFYHSIATIPGEMKFEERILSYNIQVDGSMAHAWTPYEFYINGKLSHKGVNAFTLFKDNGSWKIIHLIDTRRR